MLFSGQSPVLCAEGHVLCAQGLNKGFTRPAGGLGGHGAFWELPSRGCSEHRNHYKYVYLPLRTLPRALFCTGLFSLRPGRWSLCPELCSVCPVLFCVPRDLFCAPGHLPFCALRALFCTNRLLCCATRPFFCASRCSVLFAQDLY